MTPERSVRRPVTDLFARKPISEAHNRQETPLFANSIERHALQNNNSADVASFPTLR